MNDDGWGIPSLPADCVPAPETSAAQFLKNVEGGNCCTCKNRTQVNSILMRLRHRAHSSRRYASRFHVCSSVVSVQCEDAQHEHHSDNQADETNDAVHFDILHRGPALHVKISWIVLGFLLARYGSGRGQICGQPHSEV